MNILFDIGHPGHVHLFKNARNILIKRGHEVYFFARDKEVTYKLLKAYGIDYIKGTRQKPGMGNRIVELWQWFKLVGRVIKNHRIDIVASIGSPASAWAAKLQGVPHLAFNDTETAIEQRLLYYPASKAVFTPECVLKNYGSKHIRYKGTHDLAYLRPEQFTPDPLVRNELGVSDGERYAILRFVSWNATHDFGKKCSSVQAQLEIFKTISERMKVFISAESKLPAELEEYRIKIPPHRLHDALAYAAIVVGDGATTATEAACLGIPSIYISSFAKSLGYLFFFSSYGLLSSIIDLQDGLKEIKALIENPEIEKRRENRGRLLSETIDVACFIADKCEEYAGKKPKSN